MMNISVCNFTDKSDEEVEGVLRAINRQIAEDFAPYWNLEARLRLEGRSSSNLPIAALKQNPQDLRGDAILYLWDKVADVPGALGYHDQNNKGLPFGFIFTEIADRLGEPWSVTMSHEALELVADTNVNVLAAGPHPADSTKTVYHWYEMCDAVQAESYEIDGIGVSNFVLPLYFTFGDQIGARNDFLNRKHANGTLPSFGINPGGYVGFFNPASGSHETFSVKGDEKARARLKIKGEAFQEPELTRGRRSTLYRTLPTRAASGDEGLDRYRRAV
jgi:hypothetical protein